MQRHIEGCSHIHFLHHVAQGGGAYDKQAPPLRRVLFQEHQKRLEDGVGEAGADGDVLQQALNLVKDDERQGGLQCHDTVF